MFEKRMSRRAGVSLSLAVSLAAVMSIRAEQRAAVELLLPGDEYSLGELPGDVSGAWWVLDRTAAGVVLASASIGVQPLHDPCLDPTPGGASGRRVTAPSAREPIAMVRGRANLRGGVVDTAFLSDGINGQHDTVTFVWHGRSFTLRRVSQREGYRVELVENGVPLPLREEDWQDEGGWMVRWAGDLDRDGRLDLLFDASRKYSVHTTRLFLSAGTAVGAPPVEVATLTHTAC
jgi:hypothetical protein